MEHTEAAESVQKGEELRGVHGGEGEESRLSCPSRLVLRKLPEASTVVPWLSSHKLAPLPLTFTLQPCAWILSCTHPDRVVLKRWKQHRTVTHTNNMLLLHPRRKSSLHWTGGKTKWWDIIIRDVCVYIMCYMSLKCYRLKYNRWSINFVSWAIGLLYLELYTLVLGGWDRTGGGLHSNHHPHNQSIRSPLIFRR